MRRPRCGRAGVVEGVVDVADGLGESDALVGGRVERRLPNGDGVFLVGDSLLGLRNVCLREDKCVFGGIERSACRSAGSPCHGESGVAR